MLKFLILLIIFSINLHPLDNNLNGQDSFLLNKSEIDSLEFYFLPLYKNDSVEVANIKNIKLLNLFYLNGDCSICISKMYHIDSLFQTIKNKFIKNIIIVETTDTLSFNFHRDKYNIITPVVWDKNYRIRNNLDFEENNLFFLINNSGRILIKGDLINDKKIRKNYFNTIDRFNFLE